MEPFHWPLVDEFLNRESELARLESWWASSERMPINLYGRRRVGKSWLVRRFAHGKSALILASERLAPGTQLARFATQLEPRLGVRPDIPNVAALLRAAFRLAQRDKLLLVVDEFAWLLPVGDAEAEQVLSAIQAVMEEERDTSHLKMVLCGSAVGQMEALMAERSPLHGRLVPLQIRPLRFSEAIPFLDTLNPTQRIERYAITGGMPRYLSELGHGDLRDVICSRVLDRNGPLWNEARVVLEQELKQPGVYFSILEQLATGEKPVDQIASGARVENSSVNRYLSALADLHIVRRKLPVGSGPSTRGGHWELRDPFFRFWFRYVFPYQAELEAGLRPADLWENEVLPSLASHAAPMFEEVCRDWARATHGHVAQRFGTWWGNARNDLRRGGTRTTEEIDIVGLSGGAVTLLGECRWRNKPMDGNILREIEDHKIPALRQDGYKIAQDLRILLFSRSGVTASVEQAVAGNERISLVNIDHLADPERTSP